MIDRIFASKNMESIVCFLVPGILTDRIFELVLKHPLFCEEKTCMTYKCVFGPSAAKLENYLDQKLFLTSFDIKFADFELLLKFFCTYMFCSLMI